MKMKMTTIGLVLALAATAHAQQPASAATADREQARGAVQPRQGWRVFCLGATAGGSTVDSLGAALTKDSGKTWTVADFRQPGRSLGQAAAALAQNERDLQSQLADGHWNALILQPSGDQRIEGEEQADLPAAKRLIAAFLKASPTGTVFLCGGWPAPPASARLPATIPAVLRLPADLDAFREVYAFEHRWLRPYDPQDPVGTGCTRDAQMKLFEALKAAYPELWANRRLLEIPLGDAIYRLSKHLADGAVPGLHNVADLFADGARLKPGLPQYAMDVALYAAVFGGQGVYLFDPLPLDLAVYNAAAKKGGGIPISPEQAAPLTRWTRRLVVGHPYAGHPRNQDPANVPTRSWPSVAIEPMLDVPLRDTAITRAPDGTYYMTGTIASQKADGYPDFDNNRGIRLWKSTDLKNWTDVGLVWDLDRDTIKDPRKSTWQRYWRLPLGPEQRPMVRGITAPELHRIKGDWYICFSMNQMGTGLIKSESGKPEGPYSDHGQITAGGGDPSLFEDDDGTVYWLYGGGWLAKMNADLTALAEQPVLLRPDRQSSLPGGYSKENNPNVCGDHPLAIGSGGVFLFKAQGRYYLTAADYHSRTGYSVNDTWIACADKIRGPYSHRMVMIGHGGGTTVFPDAEGQLWASFYGADDRAAFRDRPGIVPLQWTSFDDWTVYLFNNKVPAYPRQPQHVFTERGPWAEMRPLRIDEMFRDIFIYSDPSEEYYYIMGSVMSRPEELVLWRSKDLVTWEENVICRYKDLPFIKDEQPMTEFYRDFWDVHLYKFGGTFWVYFDIFRPDPPWGPHPSGWLKSTSGRPEGPYELVKHGRGLPHPVQSPDGKFTIFRSVKGEQWSCEFAEVADPINCDEKSLKFQRLRTEPANMKVVTDGSGGVKQIGNKYIYTGPRWGGAFWSQEIQRSRYSGTYDIHYLVADQPTGPYHGPPRVIPHGNIGSIFKDKKGYWWAVEFGNEQTGPWWSRPGLVPLTVKETPDDLQIELDETPDAYQRRIMGGGNSPSSQSDRKNLKENE